MIMSLQEDLCYSLQASMPMLDLTHKLHSRMCTSAQQHHSQISQDHLPIPLTPTSCAATKLSHSAKLLRHSVATGGFGCGAGVAGAGAAPLPPCRYQGLRPNACSIHIILSQLICTAAHAMRQASPPLDG